MCLRLPVRTPFAYEGAFGHLAAGAVPGCEEVRDGAYRRSLRLPSGSAVVTLTPAVDHVRCLLVLDDFRDLTTAIARCRRLLDLDADPEAVVDALSRDSDLCPVVAKAPGQRIPRTVDEAEFAVRAVLGQQVSTKAARTHAARLVTAYGRPINDPAGALTHTFPSVEELAEIDPVHLAVPKARQRTLSGLLAGLADGTVVLDSGSDWESARKQLLALPGIGPWTAEVISMRGLGDPDAFPASDLGLRMAAKQLGLPTDERTLLEHSARWRPWRSYAVQHLWTTLEHPVNHWPPRRLHDPLPNHRQPDRSVDLGRARLGIDESTDGRSDLRAQPCRLVADPGHSMTPSTNCAAYFAGELTDFDIELDMRGSEFQQRVWKALLTIPVRGHQVVWRNRRTDRCARRSRAVGIGQRPQSHRNRRSVPSRHRCQRQPHRIRRRARSKANPARIGEKASSVNLTLFD